MRFGGKRRTGSHLTPLQWCASQVKGFAADVAGVTSVLFAICFTVVFAAAAIAVDFGRGVLEKQRQQTALDAGTLAAAEKIGLPEETYEATATVQSYLKANTARGTEGTLEDLTINQDRGELNTTAATNMLTSLLNGLGIASLDIGSTSRVARFSGTIEIALVLDNSSDLAGAPLEELRAAARRLVAILFGNAQHSDSIRIAIVPFAGSVNVGTKYRNASWMDWDGGKNPAVHFENLADQDRHRIALFEAMGTSWGGCVEVRPSPHDNSDTPAISSDASSYFTPLFAPDEPDQAGPDDLDDYPNSYLNDFGGSCQPFEPVCLKVNGKSGKCDTWSTPDPTVAQMQTCKYTGATPDTSAAGSTRKGPNMHCDAQPLTPLTGWRSDIEDAITDMRAAGTANVAEGAMWGWRALSPGEPLPEGRPYNQGNNRKYMIVMARGANWNQGLRNINKSWYSAWGFAANNRLNPKSHTTSALENSMDETTRAACRGVKDSGIKVLTIGFGASSAQTRSMLQYCASKPHDAYSAETGDELLNLFESIARELVQLRVAG
jgi:Flp pilus assembly protein TadG